MTPNLEEKIDEILKYQKSAYRWAVFRAVISLLFFLLFVLLPIIATVMFIQSFDFAEITNGLQNAQNASGQMDQIGELLKNI